MGKSKSRTHKWIKAGRGVRYFEHETRKHGTRKDRYFSATYTVDGIRREMGVGWLSEGWTLDKVLTLRNELRNNARLGIGPKTLAESRALAAAKEAEAREAEIAAQRVNITLEKFFEEEYRPGILLQKKHSSRARELSLWDNHIKPHLGKVRIKDLVGFHLERLRKAMLDQGLAERSADYAWQTLSSVIGYAQEVGLFIGANPVSLQRKRDRGRRRVSDGSRSRFLSEDEAAQLLAALKARSQDVHDQTLLSLKAGLRFGEIATLTWHDVDLEHNLLTLRANNTKSARARHLPLSDELMAMFKARPRHSVLVFPGRDGGVQAQVSDTFNRTVEELGFNRGITDASQKVVFHSCRHTFASWLVMRGVPLATVQILLGHSSLAMTMRYAHLAPDHLRQAVATLDTPLDFAAPLRLVK